MGMDALFRPRSVAVVGASRSPAKVGHAVLARLRADGFPGPVVPVNPQASEVLGARCYADIRDYDGPIDLAVIAVPRDAVEAAVEAALARGVGAIVIVAAGFAETGEEGARLEARIAERCRERGAAMLGPNSVGIINTHHRLNASFAAQMPGAGGVSVISQSGAVCAAILDLASRRELGLAKLVSTGNQGGLTETAVLQALGEDPETKVIVGYLESIRSGESFVRTAARVSARKPVVLMKAGSTRVGASAVSAHIGGRAGGDFAYAAAFKRSGVIRGDRLEDLLDFASAFAAQPLPAGGRVAVVTDSGGLGVIAADAIDRRGLETAELAPATSERLGLRRGSAAEGLPVDMLDDADSRTVGAAVAAVAADSGVDAVLALLRPVGSVDMADTAEAIAAAATGDKPVLVALLGGDSARPARARLRALGVPDYPSPERAVWALAAMRDYAAWRGSPPRVVNRFPVNRRLAERVFARCRESGRATLSIMRSRQVMTAYDFRVPEGRVARSADEAVEVAAHIGYPVALKAVSPDAGHRAVPGGVKLGLASPEAVRDAFDLIVARTRGADRSVAVEGVYVERMVDHGTDVMIGMRRDEQFGPLLQFGLGGAVPEALRDVAFHLAPVTADEAMEMLRATRSYALLVGGSQADGPDATAIADCLQRLSQLVTDFPEVVEVVIDPLIVGPPGTLPVVGDAYIALTAGDAR